LCKTVISGARVQIEMIDNQQGANYRFIIQLLFYIYLAIVRVVWAVQSCHLSTRLSRSLAQGVHCARYNLQI